MLSKAFYNLNFIPLNMTSMKTKSKNIFAFNIPFYFLVITVTGLCGVFYFINASSQHNNSQVIQTPEVVSDCNLNIVRRTDLKLTKPLVLFDKEGQDAHLNSLKESILSFINEQKVSGNVSSVSVYLRELNDGNWISINEGELYSPGSLMKVPTLITILKDAQKNPAILEKELFFRRHFGGIPEQTITGPALAEGRSYKVKELLRYMIEFSDNDATATLNNEVNFETMTKLFTDMNQILPNKQQQDYPISAVEFSKYFHVLFNASYLNVDMSEYALDLLSKSAYKDGLMRGIDSNITVAHKFGERNVNGEQQLHEFGIVYLGNNPYLIGVLTKGKNNKVLPLCISGISKIVFDYMKDSNLKNGSAIK
nr:serine hydrolase [Bacteroidota bacterium]